MSCHVFFWKTRWCFWITMDAWYCSMACLRETLCAFCCFEGKQIRQPRHSTGICVYICWFVGSFLWWDVRNYFYYGIFTNKSVLTVNQCFLGQVAQPIPIHKPTAWTVKSLSKYGACFQNKKGAFARSTPPVRPSEKKPSGSVNVPRSDVSVLFFVEACQVVDVWSVDFRIWLWNTCCKRSFQNCNEPHDIGTVICKTRHSDRQEPFLSNLVEWMVRRVLPQKSPKKIIGTHLADYSEGTHTHTHTRHLKISDWTCRAMFRRVFFGTSVLVEGDPSWTKQFPGNWL